MSQKIADRVDAAEPRTQETRGFMREVRVAARHKYTPEEKVRIVLEGFRRELAVRDQCSEREWYEWKRGHRKVAVQRRREGYDDGVASLTPRRMVVRRWKRWPRSCCQLL